MIESTLTLNGPIPELSEMLRQLTGNVPAADEVTNDLPRDDWESTVISGVEGDEQSEDRCRTFEQPSPLPEVNGAARLSTETDEQYHAEDGFVSFHKLKDFAACPYEFRYFPKAFTRSPLMDIGSMIHKFILEGGEAFNRTYQLWNPPINPKTEKPYGKETQSYQKAWQEMGLPEDAKLYTSGDMQVIDEVVASIKRHQLVSQYFEPANRLIEFTVRVDSPDFLKMKSKIDMYHEYFGLVDFKTTENLDQFRWKARDYKYVEQLSFYHQLLTDFLGAAYCPVTLVVAEYTPPFRVGLFRIGAKTLQWGRDTVQRWLREYDTCLETDIWPTRYEDEKELKI